MRWNNRSSLNERILTIPKVTHSKRMEKKRGGGNDRTYSVTYLAGTLLQGLSTQTDITEPFGLVQSYGRVSEFKSKSQATRDPKPHYQTTNQHAIFPGQATSFPLWAFSAAVHPPRSDLHLPSLNDFVAVSCRSRLIELSDYSIQAANSSNLLCRRVLALRLAEEAAG